MKCNLGGGMTDRGVLIVGSANMDLVVMARRFPQPGETVFGGRFAMFPGGKGANQAVACAKLGGRTYFVGKMGNDVFRDRLLASMNQDGVCLDHILYHPTEATGTALITVDGRGQNAIVVVSGSNMKLVPSDLDRLRGVFTRVCVVLIQLEIPLATVGRAVELAYNADATVILNPAPAQRLPRSILKNVDYLTPNETEAELLTGLSVHSLKSAESAGARLLRSGVKNVMITMGKQGCLLVNEERVRLFPALRVKAVDTTAAGDAFNGALAFSLSRGTSLEDAIPFANAVAAYSVTRLGAQSSMPTMKELRTAVDFHSFSYVED
jgi:ribokinase